MRFMLALFVALLVTVSVATAQTSTTSPVLYKVRAGETEVSVAKKHSLTVAQLRRLNHNLILRKSHVLIPGEELNVNLQTAEDELGDYRWQFVGGDPAGPSLVPVFNAGQDSLLRATIVRRLNEQLEVFELPDEVKDAFRSQMEWQEPRYVALYSSPESTLVLQGLIFGGYERTKLPNGKVVTSKLKYWDGNVACLWKDSRTHKRLLIQPAAVYDGVKFDGFGYRLILFLGCQNGAFVKYELPPVEVPPPAPETVQVAIPCPPPETTVVMVPAPPETTVTPPVVRPPVRNRYYVSDYVCWATLEDVRLDRGHEMLTGQHQDNLFVGHEQTLWFSPRKRFGLRWRSSEALFDLTNRSGDHNLGLSVVPFSTSRLRLDAEGGLGYTAMVRSYWRATVLDQYTTRWDEHRLTTDGLWGYGRTQWVTPNLYADLKLRTGSLISELSGEVTLRYGWLYGKLSGDQQIRHEVTRHISPTPVTFPADTFQVREARLGIIFSKTFLAYAAYPDWRYSSDSYVFSRFGPSGGFEWNFASWWRLDGNAIRFRDFDDALWYEGSTLVHHYSSNPEWRFKLGVVYTPTARVIK